MQAGNWFAYASAVAAVAALIFSPKRLTKLEIYATYFAMIALTIYTDLFFGLLLDLYDFINPDMTLSDLILQLVLPPTAGVLILNYMPRRKKLFVPYWILTIASAVFFEWLSLKAGYLVYKGWSLFYSAAVYALGLLFLRWHLRFIRRNGDRAGMR
ncbi:CBO0543 family protein [Cohnella sp. GbtcB17]|uniref:CBO0543 family protein n=1 Tax=Cohnella sp. GbtcB17 TaxID=2824762 RepID=UPI001C2F88A7|nr:CBO0543 family protein [Cohnella sp. GbtcB17]